MLAAFAELVLTAEEQAAEEQAAEEQAAEEQAAEEEQAVERASQKPVADLGCGPGLLTAYPAGLGLPAFGIDLSPAMVALARRAYPRLRFTVGSMTALDLDDDT